MQNLSEAVAEHRERIRALEAEVSELRRALGGGSTTTIATTPQIHKHQSGSDGGPLGPTKVETYIDFKEQGSAPGAPGAGYARMYAKTDGRLYSKDDANAESGPL